jgi:hypothetical protein
MRMWIWIGKCVDVQRSIVSCSDVCNDHSTQLG